MAGKPLINSSVYMFERSSNATLYVAFVSLRLYSPLLDLGHFFSFLILYTVDRTPTIPAFERAKTVHALDRAAPVIGTLTHTFLFLCRQVLSSTKPVAP
jgi:hypothetical protein